MLSIVIILTKIYTCCFILNENIHINVIPFNKYVLVLYSIELYTYIYIPRCEYTREYTYLDVNIHMNMYALVLYPMKIFT